jgi:glycosyltransferase involved in cell wall biosynthesis
VLRFAGSVDAVGACCSTQAEFLHRGLKIPQSQIHVILEHVDNSFFSPGPPRGDKTRPVIVGIGLEERDYRTLAQASHDLDVDVRISGFSRYVGPLSKSFPNPLPANMTLQYYDWPDLVQLYRDADIVVSSIFPCRYAAGLTTLIEGLCCARPVVATRSPGLADYLEPNDGLSVVEPCDSGSMRRAIVGLLEHPEQARIQAQRGYLLASKRYAFEKAVDRLEEILKSL